MGFEPTSRKIGNRFSRAALSASQSPLHDAYKINFYSHLIIANRDPISKLSPGITYHKGDVDSLNQLAQNRGKENSNE